jgi:hypothetical protein
MGVVIAQDSLSAWPMHRQTIVEPVRATYIRRYSERFDRKPESTTNLGGLAIEVEQGFDPEVRLVIGRDLLSLHHNGTQINYRARVNVALRLAL